MSTVASVKDELDALIRAFGKAACGNEQDRAEAFALARVYVSLTRDLFDSMRRNPWNYAVMIAFGKRIDPYEPARAATKAFIAKWSG